MSSPKYRFRFWIPSKLSLAALYSICVSKHMLPHFLNIKLRIFVHVLPYKSLTRKIVSILVFLKDEFLGLLRNFSDNE